MNEQLQSDSAKNITKQDKRNVLSHIIARVKKIGKRTTLILSILIVVIILAGGAFAYLVKTGKIKFSADTTTSTSQPVVLLFDNFQNNGTRGVGGRILTDNEALYGNTVLSFNGSALPTRSIVNGCRALTKDYPISQAATNTLYTFSYGLKGTITGQLTMKIDWKEKNSKGIIVPNSVEKTISPSEINSTNWTIINKLFKTPTNFVAGSLVFEPILQCNSAQYIGSIDSLAVLRVAQQDHQTVIGQNNDGDINAIDYTQSTIPLNIQIDKPLQSLNISGGGTISDPYGYANAVLEGKDNSENLIAENYDFNANGKFTFGSMPVETAIMDNIAPKNLVIYSNQADWNIDDITIVLKESKLDNTTRQMISGATTRGVSNQAARDKVKTAIRTTEATNIATGINSWLKNNQQKATAAANSISALPYSEKLLKFGSSGGLSFNDQMLSDYNSGYLSMNTAPNTDPNWPSAFSWTDVNGQNWLSPVKDQYQCGSCYAFAGVAQIEAAINLKYNQHLDNNLSEQQAMCATNGCRSGKPGDVLNHFSTSPLWGSDLNPYTASDRGSACNINQPATNIPTLGWENFTAPNHVDNNNNEITAAAKQASFNSGLTNDYMQEIQKYGPIAVTFPEYHHVMLVAGWTTIDGKLTWIIKNSWGNDWGVNLNMQSPQSTSTGYDGGYFFYQTGGVTWSWSVLGVKFSYHDPFPFKQDDPTADVVPTSNVPTQLQKLAPIVKCADVNGFGFYSWGIGSKPSTCPASAPAEEACNTAPGSLSGYSSDHVTCQNIYTYNFKNGTNTFTFHLGQDAINKYKNYKWQISKPTVQSTAQSTLFSGKPKLPCSGRGCATILATGSFTAPNPAPLEGNVTAIWNEGTTAPVGAQAQFNIIDQSGQLTYGPYFTIK